MNTGTDHFTCYIRKEVQMVLDPHLDPLFHPDSELNRPGIAWSRADMSQYGCKYPCKRTINF